MELLVVYCLCRKTFSLKKIALVCTCGNLITHPIVFFGFLSSGLSILNAVLWAELFAPAAEGLIYRRYLKQRPLYYFMFVSLVANIVSWQFGPVFTYLFFWR
ncbi:MAG: hypothetical protein A2270_06455 [Elusimicrobia bacterium RIFOXYA12_FULL_51_18]|nr:MAG: hypothetical protein A2270_06455 [Elusimicrobia bacterium RIFOXYA12_FULL_51_18]